MQGVNVISRSDAISIGQKWYFTGNPCQYGHIAKRGVKNSTCYGCQQTRSTKYRQQNPTYWDEYNPEYYSNNKERTAQHSNAYAAHAS